MRRGGSGGLGLVEVLVALGILAILLTSVVALQATSLRATRTAAIATDLASAAEAEARLRSLVESTGPACAVATRWSAVATCEVDVTCADLDCSLRLHEVRVTAATGNEIVVIGAGPLADPASEGLAP